jgi:hypothetical protein
VIFVFFFVLFVVNMFPRLLVQLSCRTLLFKGSKSQRGEKQKLLIAAFDLLPPRLLNGFLRDNDRNRISVMNLVSAPMRADTDAIDANVLAEKPPKFIVVARVGKRRGQLSLHLHFHPVMRHTRSLHSGATDQTQKLFQCQSAVMRWIEEFFKVIVRGYLLRRRAAIGYQYPSSGATHTRHFSQNNIGIQKMMESISAHDNREFVIWKWQRLNIPLPPGEIRQTASLRQQSGLFEHRGRDVNAGDVTRDRGECACHHPRATGHIQRRIFAGYLRHLDQQTQGLLIRMPRRLRKRQSLSGELINGNLMMVAYISTWSHKSNLFASLYRSDSGIY